MVRELIAPGNVRAGSRVRFVDQHTLKICTGTCMKIARSGAVVVAHDGDQREPFLFQARQALTEAALIDSYVVGDSVQSHCGNHAGTIVAHEPPARPHSGTSITTLWGDGRRTQQAASALLVKAGSSRVVVHPDVRPAVNLLTCAATSAGFGVQKPTAVRPDFTAARNGGVDFTDEHTHWDSQFETGIKFTVKASGATHLGGLHEGLAVGNGIYLNEATYIEAGGQVAKDADFGNQVHITTERKLRGTNKNKVYESIQATLRRHEISIDKHQKEAHSEYVIASANYYFADDHTVTTWLIDMFDGPVGFICEGTSPNVEWKEDLCITQDTNRKPDARMDTDGDDSENIAGGSPQPKFDKILDEFFVSFNLLALEDIPHNGELLSNYRTPRVNETDRQRQNLPPRDIAYETIYSVGDYESFYAEPGGVEVQDVCKPRDPPPKKLRHVGVSQPLRTLALKQNIFATPLGRKQQKEAFAIIEHNAEAGIDPFEIAYNAEHNIDSRTGVAYTSKTREALLLGVSIERALPLGAPTSRLQPIVQVVNKDAPSILPSTLKSQNAHGVEIASAVRCVARPEDECVLFSHTLFETADALLSDKTPFMDLYLLHGDTRIYEALAELLLGTGLADDYRDAAQYLSKALNDRTLQRGYLLDENDAKAVFEHNNLVRYKAKQNRGEEKIKMPVGSITVEVEFANNPDVFLSCLPSMSYRRKVELLTKALAQNQDINKQLTAAIGDERITFDGTRLSEAVTDEFAVEYKKHLANNADNSKLFTYIKACIENQTMFGHPDDVAGQLAEFLVATNRMTRTAFAGVNEPIQCVCEVYASDDTPDGNDDDIELPSADDELFAPVVPEHRDLWVSMPVCTLTFDPEMDKLNGYFSYNEALEYLLVHKWFSVETLSKKVSADEAEAMCEKEWESLKVVKSDNWPNQLPQEPQNEYTKVWKDWRAWAGYDEDTGALRNEAVLPSRSSEQIKMTDLKPFAMVSATQVSIGARSFTLCKPTVIVNTTEVPRLTRVEVRAAHATFENAGDLHTEIGHCRSVHTGVDTVRVEITGQLTASAAESIGGTLVQCTPNNCIEYCVGRYDMLTAVRANLLQLLDDVLERVLVSDNGKHAQDGNNFYGFQESGWISGGMAVDATRKMADLNKWTIGYNTATENSVTFSIKQSYVTFFEARQIASKLTLGTPGRVQLVPLDAKTAESENHTKWRRHWATPTNHLPDGLPKNPDDVYKNNGWLGWTDFLAKKAPNSTAIAGTAVTDNDAALVGTLLAQLNSTEFNVSSDDEGAILVKCLLGRPARAIMHKALKERVLEKVARLDNVSISRYTLKKPNALIASVYRREDDGLYWLQYAPYPSNNLESDVLFPTCYFLERGAIVLRNTTCVKTFEDFTFAKGGKLALNKSPDLHCILHRQYQFDGPNYPYARTDKDVHTKRIVPALDFSAETSDSTVLTDAGVIEFDPLSVVGANTRLHVHMPTVGSTTVQISKSKHSFEKIPTDQITKVCLSELYVGALVSDNVTEIVQKFLLGVSHSVPALHMVSSTLMDIPPERLARVFEVIKIDQKLVDKWKGDVDKAPLDKFELYARQYHSRREYGDACKSALVPRCYPQSDRDVRKAYPKFCGWRSVCNSTGYTITGSIDAKFEINVTYYPDVNGDLCMHATTTSKTTEMTCTSDPCEDFAKRMQLATLQYQLRRLAEPCIISVFGKRQTGNRYEHYNEAMITPVFNKIEIIQHQLEYKPDYSAEAFQFAKAVSMNAVNNKGKKYRVYAYDRNNLFNFPDYFAARARQVGYLEYSAACTAAHPYIKGLKKCTRITYNEHVKTVQDWPANVPKTYEELVTVYNKAGWNSLPEWLSNARVSKSKMPENPSAHYCLDGWDDKTEAALSVKDPTKVRWTYTYALNRFHAHKKSKPQDQGEFQTAWKAFRAEAHTEFIPDNPEKHYDADWRSFCSPQTQLKKLKQVQEGKELGSSDEACACAYHKDKDGHTRVYAYLREDTAPKDSTLPRGWERCKDEDVPTNLWWQRWGTRSVFQDFVVSNIAFVPSRPLILLNSKKHMPISNVLCRIKNDGTGKCYSFEIVPNPTTDGFQHVQTCCAITFWRNHEVFVNPNLVACRVNSSATEQGKFSADVQEQLGGKAEKMLFAKLRVGSTIQQVCPTKGSHWVPPPPRSIDFKTALMPVRTCAMLLATSDKHAWVDPEHAKAWSASIDTYTLAALLHRYQMIGNEQLQLDGGGASSVHEHMAGLFENDQSCVIHWNYTDESIMSECAAFVKKKKWEDESAAALATAVRARLAKDWHGPHLGEHVAWKNHVEHLKWMVTTCNVPKGWEGLADAVHDEIDFVFSHELELGLLDEPDFVSHFAFSQRVHRPFFQAMNEAAAIGGQIDTAISDCTFTPCSVFSAKNRDTPQQLSYVESEKGDFITIPTCQLESAITREHTVSTELVCRAIIEWFAAKTKKAARITCNGTPRFVQSGGMTSRDNDSGTTHAPLGTKDELEFLYARAMARVAIKPLCLQWVDGNLTFSSSMDDYDHLRENLVGAIGDYQTGTETYKHQTLEVLARMLQLLVNMRINENSEESQTQYTEFSKKFLHPAEKDSAPPAEKPNPTPGQARVPRQRQARSTDHEYLRLLTKPASAYHQYHADVVSVLPTPPVNYQDIDDTEWTTLCEDEKYPLCDWKNLKQLDKNITQHLTKLETKDPSRTRIKNDAYMAWYLSRGSSTMPDPKLTAATHADMIIFLLDCYAMDKSFKALGEQLVLKDSQIADQYAFRRYNRRRLKVLSPFHDLSGLDARAVEEWKLDIDASLLEYLRAVLGVEEDTARPIELAAWTNARNVFESYTPGENNSFATKCGKLFANEHLVKLVNIKDPLDIVDINDHENVRLTINRGFQIKQYQEYTNKRGAEIEAPAPADDVAPAPKRSRSATAQPMLKQLQYVHDEYVQERVVFRYVQKKVPIHSVVDWRSSFLKKKTREQKKACPTTRDYEKAIKTYKFNYDAFTLNTPAQLDKLLLSNPQWRDKWTQIVCAAGYKGNPFVELDKVIDAMLDTHHSAGKDSNNEYLAGFLTAVITKQDMATAPETGEFQDEAWPFFDDKQNPLVVKNGDYSTKNRAIMTYLQMAEAAKNKQAKLAKALNKSLKKNNQAVGDGGGDSSEEETLSAVLNRRKREKRERAAAEPDNADASDYSGDEEAKRQTHGEAAEPELDNAAAADNSEGRRRGDSRSNSLSPTPSESKEYFAKFKAEKKAEMRKRAKQPKTASAKRTIGSNVGNPSGAGIKRLRRNASSGSSMGSNSGQDELDEFSQVSEWDSLPLTPVHAIAAANGLNVNTANGFRDIISSQDLDDLMHQDNDGDSDGDDKAVPEVTSTFPGPLHNNIDDDVYLGSDLDSDASFEFGEVAPETPEKSNSDGRSEAAESERGNGVIIADAPDNSAEEGDKRPQPASSHNPPETATTRNTTPTVDEFFTEVVDSQDSDLFPPPVQKQVEAAQPALYLQFRDYDEATCGGQQPSILLNPVAGTPQELCSAQLFVDLGAANRQWRTLYSRTTATMILTRTAEGIKMTLGEIGILRQVMLNGNIIDPKDPPAYLQKNDCIQFASSKFKDRFKCGIGTYDVKEVGT